jgi:hypothetical protein
MPYVDTDPEEQLQTCTKCWSIIPLRFTGLHDKDCHGGS